MTSCCDVINFTTNWLKMFKFNVANVSKDLLPFVNVKINKKKVVFAKKQKVQLLQVLFYFFYDLKKICYFSTLYNLSFLN